MSDKECLRTVQAILGSLKTTIEDLKKCLILRDKRRMKDVVKSFYGTLTTTLPLFDEIIAKTEKTAEDKALLNLLPVLQRIGSATEDLVNGVQAAVEVDISFTDKALAEIAEIMGTVTDLARDTYDALSSENQRFREYALSEARSIGDRIRGFGVEHQQRLVVGLCVPKASFLYLDMMNSLKRVTQELSELFEVA